MLDTEFNMDDALRVRHNDGIIEGEQKKAEKIAINLLRNGLSKDIVIENTELSAERVDQLIKNIKSENFAGT